MTNREESVYITISKAANRAGLESQVVRHCVSVGLVRERLTEEDLAELRRVRRLTALGVNMPGVEIILRMRRQVLELRAELERLRVGGGK